MAALPARSGRDFYNGMLQPLQLKDVSIRYADAIAELRDFLGKAGFSTGTAETLRTLAAELPRDRALRRDLASHLWVLIDRSGGKIAHSDLLGVLAVAAAGTRFAAEAHADDAHDLLRFVMEARRSLDAPSAERQIAVERMPATPHRSLEQPAGTAAAPVPLAGTEPLRPAGNASWKAPASAVARGAVAVSRVEAPQRAGGRRLVWMLALALCLLAAVSAGVWQYRKPAAESGSATAVAPTVTRVSPQTEELPSVTRSSEDVGINAAADPQTTLAERIPPRGTPRATPRDTPRRTQTEVAAVSPATAPTTASRTSFAPSATVAAPETHAPILRTYTPAEATVVVLPAARPATSTSPSILPHAAPAPPAAPKPVPAAMLSKQLGSSGIPAYASQPDPDATIDGRKYPRLLRRRTSLTDANLVAELRPGAGPADAAGRAGAAPAGVVRPTSIGIMAGNLVYSPTPAYPAAASAAHVQGEVKVQAEIDRDGNVVSARVVSGPPMLRDAAVDAVQHWRYKPYVQKGKPIPMSAVAVVDFQLP